MPEPKATSMLPSERQRYILDLFREEISIRVSRLSELLGVSDMTIRRDLDILERRGLLERTHGGAVFRHERMAGANGYQYASSMQKFAEEKQRIAQQAASLIEADDTIYLGQGATAALVLRYLDPLLPCMVFTNNLGTLTEIEGKAVQLILLGGKFKPSTNSLTGMITVEMIRQVYANKFFLGVDGISIRDGLTTSDVETAVIERAMLLHTRGQTITLADHSKFGRVGEMVLTPVERVDVLITDRGTPVELRNDLEAVGIRIMVV